MQPSIRDARRTPLYTEVTAGRFQSQRNLLAMRKFEGLIVKVLCYFHHCSSMNLHHRGTPRTPGTYAWTLQHTKDWKLIRIILMKSNRIAANCWASLLEGEYSADPLVQDQMQKKLTLERLQREVMHNPGFDFSGAELSGNYSKGGPDFSCLENECAG
ncbi:nudC domain-containing protein 2-like [Ascaphus truei]|uniref:nudC domain-containing protein 2-like n=1 Tax=Ascaphus truei TaxID=8439 RepID=UPI003F590A58